MSNFWNEAFDETDTGVFDPSKLESVLEETEAPVSQDTVTLINLGKLSHSFDLWGHKIVIRTLKINEELEVGQIVSSFKGSEHEDRAYITALMAAAIEEVDGAPIYLPLGPTDSLIRGKFEYVKNNFYWPVILEIFKEYTSLNKRVADSLAEIKKN